MDGEIYRHGDQINVIALKILYFGSKGSTNVNLTILFFIDPFLPQCTQWKLQLN